MLHSCDSIVHSILKRAFLSFNISSVPIISEWRGSEGKYGCAKWRGVEELFRCKVVRPLVLSASLISRILAVFSDMMHE